MTPSISHGRLAGRDITDRDASLACSRRRCTRISGYTITIVWTFTKLNDIVNGNGGKDENRCKTAKSAKAGNSATEDSRKVPQNRAIGL